MKWNPADYETVKSRKKRFYEDHPDGRIEVESISTDPNEYAYFKATVFVSREDQEKNCPKGTGYAHEIRDKELSQGKKGSYESVNYSSWNENCEESAIGRALDNAGYSGNLKCSREEMEQAEKKNNSYNPMKKPDTDTLWVTSTQFEELMLLNTTKSLTDAVNGLKAQGAVFNKAQWSALTTKKKNLIAGGN